MGTSAYERAFDSVSRQIMREMREKSNMAGSTAITVFMSGNAIHVANVGDSRAILGRCAHFTGGLCVASPSKAVSGYSAPATSTCTPGLQPAGVRALGAAAFIHPCVAQSVATKRPRSYANGAVWCVAESRPCKRGRRRPGRTRCE